MELLGAQVKFVGSRYRTRIIEAGSGPPLLLLHGTGGHAENYIRNIMPFSRHFRTIAVDFLWHGASDTGHFDPELMPPLLDQIQDVLDALSIDRVHVEGQSLGGWVAALLAMRHRDRVEKLILTTPMGYAPDAGTLPDWTPPDFDRLRENSLDCLRNPTFENVRTRIARIVHDPAVLTDEAVAVRHRFYNDPALNRAQQMVITNYLGGSKPQRHALTDDNLRTIKVPSLVYWGEYNLTPPALGRRLASRIPSARFHCAANTGHWAQFENFEEHNAVVLEFLNQAQADNNKGNLCHTIPRTD
ncbi:MAG: alpha/beta hydrolase [Bradyrhizobium sp.]